MSKYKIFLLFSTILVAAAILWETTCRGVDDIEDNKTRAQIIIDAIEQYETAHGFSPSSLDTLVPEFLIEIPVTIDGEEFLYDGEEQNSSSRADWIIQFNVPSEMMGCAYISRSRRWECSLPGAGYH